MSECGGGQSIERASSSPEMARAHSGNSARRSREPTRERAREIAGDDLDLVRAEVERPAHARGERRHRVFAPFVDDDASRLHHHGEPKREIGERDLERPQTTALVGGTVFAAYVIVSEVMAFAGRRTSAQQAVPASTGGRVVSMADYKRPARARAGATSDRAKAA